MKMLAARLAFLLVAAGLAPAARAAADLELPAATASLSQQVGITIIRVDYARRPLREPALPAAPAAAPLSPPVARITFSRDVDFLGTPVAAGTYALLLVPGDVDWVVLLNRDLDLISAARHRLDLDVARARARAQTGPHRQRLELTFTDFDDERAVLQVAWGDLRVELPVRVHTHEQIDAAIAALDDGWRWYADAAGYLWNVRHDRAASLRNIEKSIALQPNDRNSALRASLLAAREPRQAGAVIAPASTGGLAAAERSAPAHAPAASASPAAAEVAGAIERGRSELQACYQRALRRDPALTRADVDLQIDIGTSGAVKAIRLDPTSPPPALEACIRAAVGRWVFPPAGAEYRTSVPLLVRGHE